jgi:hypothetical protein
MTDEEQLESLRTTFKGAKQYDSGFTRVCDWEREHGRSVDWDLKETWETFFGPNGWHESIHPVLDGRYRSDFPAPGSTPNST